MNDEFEQEERGEFEQEERGESEQEERGESEYNQPSNTHVPPRQAPARRYPRSAKTFFAKCPPCGGLDEHECALKVRDGVAIFWRYKLLSAYNDSEEMQQLMTICQGKLSILKVIQQKKIWQKQDANLTPLTKFFYRLFPRTTSYSKLNSDPNELLTGFKFEAFNTGAIAKQWDAVRGIPDMLVKFESKYADFIHQDAKLPIKAEQRQLYRLHLTNTLQLWADLGFFSTDRDVYSEYMHWKREIDTSYGYLPPLNDPLLKIFQQQIKTQHKISYTALKLARFIFDLERGDLSAYRCGLFAWLRNQFEAIPDFENKKEIFVSLLSIKLNQMTPAVNYCPSPEQHLANPNRFCTQHFATCNATKYKLENIDYFTSNGAFCLESVAFQLAELIDRLQGRKLANYLQLLRKYTGETGSQELFEILAEIIYEGNDYMKNYFQLSTRSDAPRRSLAATSKNLLALVRFLVSEVPEYQIIDSAPISIHQLSQYGLNTVFSQRTPPILNTNEFNKFIRNQTDSGDVIEIKKKAGTNNSQDLSSDSDQRYDVKVNGNLVAGIEIQDEVHALTEKPPFVKVRLFDSGVTAGFVSVMEENEILQAPGLVKEHFARPHVAIFVFNQEIMDLHSYIIYQFEQSNRTKYREQIRQINNELMRHLSQDIGPDSESYRTLKERVSQLLVCCLTDTIKQTHKAISRNQGDYPNFDLIKNHATQVPGNILRVFQAIYEKPSDQPAVMPTGTVEEQYVEVFEIMNALKNKRDFTPRDVYFVVETIKYFDPYRIDPQEAQIALINFYNQYLDAAQSTRGGGARWRR